MEAKWPPERRYPALGRLLPAEEIDVGTSSIRTFVGGELASVANVLAEFELLIGCTFDALIEQKKGLAADLLEAGGETLVTEMSDQDVVRMVSLDLRSALADE